MAGYGQRYRPFRQHCKDCGGMDMHECPKRRKTELVDCWFPPGEVLIWKEEGIYASEKRGRVKWRMLEGLMRNFSVRSR
jgi:hypothetical protein